MHQPVVPEKSEIKQTGNSSLNLGRVLVFEFAVEIWVQSDRVDDEHCSLKEEQTRLHAKTRSRFN